MGFLDDLVEGMGEAFKYGSNEAIWNAWMEMEEEEEALNSIEAFVSDESAQRIEEMDVHIQTKGIITFGSMGIKTLRYYAFFKVSEFNRFRRWRGFGDAN